MRCAVDIGFSGSVQHGNTRARPEAPTSHEMVDYYVETAVKPLRKLYKELKDFPADPSAEQVHELRTQARRLEAVVHTFSSDSDGEGQRLLKLMKPVRKAAGKVRDVDVFYREASSRSSCIRSRATRPAQGWFASPSTLRAGEKSILAAFTGRSRAEASRSAARCGTMGIGSSPQRA